VEVDTTGSIYDDFSRLLFLYTKRESSTLVNEIPEESDQFRFFCAVCYANIKGSVGLILAKTSDMRISIPIDLSSRPFIPLPGFIRSRRPLPLLAPSLVFISRCSGKLHMRGFYLRILSFLTPHSFSVTFFPSTPSVFTLFILLQINTQCMFQDSLSSFFGGFD
jgi:hypothetical protein